MTPLPLTCLLLHGVAGTPAELRPVADALVAAGFRVRAPLLPGHGGDAAAYLASGFAQWRACARAEYLRLRAQGPVLLAGYSLGGILALDCALDCAPDCSPDCAAAGHSAPAGASPGASPRAEPDRSQPAGLLLLATPLFFGAWRHGLAQRGAGSWRFRCLGLLARLSPVTAAPPRSPEARAVAPWQGHEDLVCWRHFAEMKAALAPVRAGLPRLQAPVCAITLAHDAACPPAQARYLADRCGSADVRLHLLRTRSPHGGHLPATHRECRDRVAALCVAFARHCADRQLARGAPAA